MASPETEQVASDASPSGWLTRPRSLMLRGAVTVGLLVWVLVMPVTTISFVTNPITELSFRRVTEMSIPAIWSHQLANLPDVSVSWAMNATFAGGMAVTVICVVLGCWLLLSPGGGDPRRGERRRA